MSHLKAKLQIIGVSIAAIVAAISLSLSGIVFSAASQSHKVAIHVDENDPARMNMALNNVANVKKYYDSVGEEVQIELVAYGPGLHMFRTDTSPVKDRIVTMSLEIENLKFSACGNTHSAMTKKAGKEITLLEEASLVPSGVVQLITLQEQGYAYVRP